VTIFLMNIVIISTIYVIRILRNVERIN